ncbi:MAG: DUF3800 domain-containing protein [Flavobacteriales bacterium]|nr:DUF3800 domain-containing protein [Crocinitomicaceae bacterium]NBX81322.1 DUF3800 domain-containing protein [Flavobacteriales bacterium]
MYFLYVDESGDCGAYDSSKPDRTGTKYFIMSGILVHVDKWKISLDLLKAFRRKIARDGYLAYDVEFHCSELIDPHKVQAYTSISVKDRWRILEEFATVIGDNQAFKIINVVIDKSNTDLQPNEFITSSISELYSAFDEFLKNEKTRGLVFLDRANEKVVNTHVRKLLGTGVSYEQKHYKRIGWIIEDPIFRISSDSMFIQAADTIAYCLKEHEFSTQSKRKFQAHKFFASRLKKIIFESVKTNEKGFINA